MVHLSAEIIPHFEKAVREHLDWLESEAAKYGDQFPDDFEPNDIALYRSLLVGLSQSTQTGVDIDRATFGKVFRFMMGLLPFYVKEHRNAISIADYNALFRAYCEFKLQECLELVAEPRELGSQSGLGANFRRWAHMALTDIERFPD